MDSLKDKRTRNELKRAIQQLPTGTDALAETYNSAFLRISGQKENDRHWAQRLLSFVVHATCPLKSNQLRHALATEEGSSQIDEDNCPILDEIISLCAGLAVHNQESDTIQLVHYTTYDFLRKVDWIQKGSALVAISCTQYLMSDTFSSGSCATKNELERRIESNHFYLYATMNWAHHVRSSALEEHGVVLEFLEKDKQVSACAQALFSTLLPRHDPSGNSLPRALSGMHLAAYFGLTSSIAVLLGRGHDKDSVDGYGQTPLCWAIHGGYWSTVKSLIDNGADPNLVLVPEEYGTSPTQLWKTTDGATHEGPSKPLTWAVRFDNLNMVRLLLEKGANPDLDLPGGCPPLCWATKEENHAIVKLLLEYGANPDLSPPGCGSPLWLAMRKGDNALVMLLSERGASIICPTFEDE